MRRLWYLLPSVVLAASAAWAQEIRLTDETSLAADVLQTDDESVIVRIPRSAVATVDGTPLPPALVAGVAAPPFAAKDLAGTPQVLNNTTGKATLLHFWVSWCPHCQADAPKIQTLHDQFQDHPNFQVITVNLDQDRTALDAFVQERKVTYPVIVASEQAAAPNGVDLPKLYQMNAFPVTFLIDDQGIIRQKVIGSFVEANVELLPRITELLPAGSSASAEAAPAQPTQAAALATQPGGACDCSKACGAQAAGSFGEAAPAAVIALPAR